VSETGPIAAVRACVMGAILFGAIRVAAAAPFIQQAKLPDADGAASDEFGDAVAMSGTTAVVGARFHGSQHGAAYVYVQSGNSWTLQSELAGPQAGDNFGTAVALSGDTLVVGAETDSTSGIGQLGAAYVFVRSGATWTQQQKLAPTDGAQYDYFGTSVGISGDTIVVGSYQNNGARGAAYVYVRSGTTWTLQQKLTASDATAGDNFGTAVSVAGDIAAIGTFTSTTPHSAYVFVRSGATWTQQQKLLPADGGANDDFGISVSVSGTTVAVGGEANALSPGAVYVYVQNGTSWPQQQKLVASDGANGDELGLSVAVSGDELIAGAPGKASSAGAAYVFARSGTTWSQQAKVVASDGAAQDEFGFAVSVSGTTVIVGAADKNGFQGAAYAFVPGCTPGATQCSGNVVQTCNSSGVWQNTTTCPDICTGAGVCSGTCLPGAYQCVGNTSQICNASAAWQTAEVCDSSCAGSGTCVPLVQRQKLVASNGVANDHFANQVAMSGDTFVIGTNKSSGQGAAYVFVHSGASWSQQQELQAPDGGNNDSFSYSVSISGDTIVAGAPGKNAAYVFVRSGTTWSLQQEISGPTGDYAGDSVSVWGDTLAFGATLDNGNRGAAFVYVRSGTTWTPQQTVVASDGQQTDLFGGSMSLWRDTLLVGNSRSTSPGEAYVFVRSGTSWTQQQILSASDGTAGEGFGRDVSLSGGTAIVGASSWNTSQGAAYVFVQSGTTWTQQQKLVASNGATANFFGESVAVAGDSAIVGAYGVGPNQTGAAYLFTRSGTTWTQQQEVQAADGAPSDLFGTSAAIAGTTALVSAAYKSSTTGAAYVFVGSSPSSQVPVPPIAAGLLAAVLAAAGLMLVGRGKRSRKT
jgi:hypothetical protein